MRSATTRSNTLDELVAALQSGICDEATACRLCQLGPHAVTLALRAAARRIAEQDARIAELQTQSSGKVSPSTPAGMRPVYTKPNAPGGRRRKKPGARKGHTGHHRPTPTRIDERKEQRLDALLAGGDESPAPPNSPAAACRLPIEVFADADVWRLCKRLRRTGDHLFTFLDYPQIPFENNFAERMIRPAVILRKNSQSNRSDRGARTQAVLMSVYRTPRLRGRGPARCDHRRPARLPANRPPPATTPLRHCKRLNSYV